LSRSFTLPAEIIGIVHTIARLSFLPGGEVAVAVGLSGGAQSGGGTVATHLPFWYIPQRRSTIGLRLPHLR